MKNKCLKIAAVTTMTLLSTNIFTSMYMEESARIAGMIAQTTQAAEPTEYQDTENDIQYREQQAIDEFTRLLTDPVKEVKQWVDFCQTEINLLEGNEKYAALREALLKIQYEKNQTKIFEALKPHFATLPQEVIDALNSFSGLWGKIQLSYRIKN